MLIDEEPLQHEVDEDGNKVFIGDGISLGGERDWADAVFGLAKKVHFTQGEFEGCFRCCSRACLTLQRADSRILGLDALSFCDRSSFGTHTVPTLGLRKVY